jgi:hypothetical protein
MDLSNKAMPAARLSRSVLDRPAKPVASAVSRPADHLRSAEFATLYSRHGHGVDVRQTFGHLPFQPFWTWLTGKSLWPHEPRRPQETWLTEWQLWLQIVWGYSVIVGSVLMASIVWNAGWPIWQALPVYVVSWILVVNRTRGLLHTFHYTNHGATIVDMKRARVIATCFLSVPIMHTSWRNYHRLHAQVHHGSNSLCTDSDPDQQFMTQHGFYRGMSERRFWTLLVVAPLRPSNIWAHIKFRLEENFVTAEPFEIALRASYWLIFCAAVTYFQVWTEILLFLLFPLFFLTQISSWIQHTTEHLWFPVRPEGSSLHIFVGAMTWGRFFGRPYPPRDVPFRAPKLLWWWTRVFAIDLPIRLFAFMQDLSCHDFHHRSPRVNFWRISQERRAHEARPSKFGPMTETWSVWESWLVLRDHLCRGEHDPFGVFAWERARNRKSPA